MTPHVRVGLCTLAIVTAVATAARAGEVHTNGFPRDPGFFPIGVWLQSSSRASQYKAMGINTYVGISGGTTEIALTQLARNQMFAISTQNDSAMKLTNSRVIKAWMHEDEPDNAQPIGYGLYGSCIPASEVVLRTRAMKERDPTRPVMINFGQGVANEFWRGRGPCNGDDAYYDVAVMGADILSFDIYPVASKVPEVKGKLEYVARGVRNLVKRANGSQNVWAILETTAIESDRRIRPAQLRAEIWMALIHGARGLAYFVHEFSPRFREDGIFRYAEIVEEVTRMNQLIASLAPVLHGPNADGEVTVDSTVPIATMSKLHDGALYLFAVAMKPASARARFTLRAPDQGTAYEIGGERRLTVVHGAFEDNFDEYGAHAYRIPLGSR